MTLVIAEKPDLGKAIAAAIMPHHTVKKGYIEDDGMIVTWAFGHLFRLKAPDDYDPALKKWELSTLPIYFDDWGIKPDEDKKDQIKLIGSFLKKADMVIHAGDPDDEGQLLIDEILDYFKYKGKVMRLSTNDLTPAVIQKAYRSMVDNQAMRPLGEAARARQVADFVVGINYSRYFSIKNAGTLSVGRVQSPTLGLVVARDELIDGHKKILFHDGYVHTHIVPEFSSTLCVRLPRGHKLLNDDGRVTNQKALQDILAGLKGKLTDITITKQIKDEAPPLPFNLTKLQTAVFQRFHYNPEQTLSITQSLREKYHLITYNRSTCQYLNDEQFDAAPKVVTATLANLGANIPGIDIKRKSAAFNSKKVGESAHTGIIPTETRADLSKLTEQERNVYRLIAAQYLAQFMPPAKKEITRASAVLPDDLTATASATKIVDKGYRAVLPVKDDAGDEDPALCGIFNGLYEGCKIEEVSTKEKETKPPPRYNLASLGEDMTRISKYVTDPRIKKLLIAKDDGKEGENGSIGTPATRDAIVKKLIQRGFLEVKGGKVFSTKLGKDFYQILPDEVKTADLTAEWWAICEDIKDGKSTSATLHSSVMASINKLLNSDYKGSALTAASPKGNGAVGDILGVCPLCGKPVKSGKYGAYCTGFKDIPSSNACPFRFGKKQYGKDLTPKQIRDLLSGKRILVRGLVSFKTKKTYDAYLSYSGKVNEKGYAVLENPEFEGVPAKKRQKTGSKSEKQ